MTWGENLFQNVLTVGILGSLVLIVYLKYTKKTFGELIREIRDFFREKPVELYDEVQGGYDGIR